MKRIIIAMSFLMFTAVSQAETQKQFTGSDYAQTMLLLSQSDFDIRLAAKSIYRMESARQSILDLAAELTWATCAGGRAMNIDTLSWLVKALGKTKQARYAGVLDHCLSITTDKKVLKYLTEAKSSIEATTATPFEGGKMNLVQMRAQMIRDVANASTRDQAASSFGKLRHGQSLDEIYSSLGVPNDVKGVNVVRDKKAGHGYVRIETSEYMVELAYNGFGTIRFGYDAGNAKWTLNEAKSERGLIWTWGGGRFVATMDDLILLGDSVEVYDIARRLLNLSKVERATLDRIADRLSQSRGEEDSKRADALAWLCKVIAKNRDGRYKPLMLDLASTATNKALKKYAGLAASELPETAEEKYTPVLAQKAAAGL